MQLCHKQYIIVSSEHEACNMEISNPYIPLDMQTTIYTPLLQPRIIMPDDILKKAIRFSKLKCPVQFLCICDCILSLYYFNNSWVFGTICSIASFNGLLATIYYKKSLFTCYVGYQYFQFTCRFANLSYFIYIMSNHDTLTITNSTIPLYNSSIVQYTYTGPLQLIILFSMFIMQVYIAYIITLFYTLMPTEHDKEQIEIEATI
jgi:hypothetical protein